MTVTTHARGPVLVITIDRPEVHNCIDGATARALEAAWERLAGDDALAVGVLTGAGASFCAGADLHALETLGPEAGSDRATRERFFVGTTGFLGGTRRVHLGKPVIAAVEGHCLAGGLELALLCDLRVASETARFGVTCRRYNVPLVDGGTQRLPRVVGLGHALDLILSGRVIDAGEAHRIGLANEVVAAGDALERALVLAERLSALPQQALRADLVSVHEGLGRPLAEALALEARRGQSVIEGPGFEAGVRRFNERERGEKRKP